MPEFRLDGAGPPNLQGFTALITGAGSGIGRATAAALAAAGAAQLWLVGRDHEKLTASARAIGAAAPGCRCRTIAADLSQSVEHGRLVREVVASGRLDALVNNAGAFAGESLRETTDAELARILEINLAAPYRLTRDLLPLLSKSPLPSVVNVSSTLAVKPIPSASAYNASKAALCQLTRTLALELGQERIRVNAVLPAIVDTPMYRGRYGDEASYQQSLPAVHKLHPLGRMGKPEDIAGAVLFLVGPASSWITGVTLPVDGGMLVT